MNIKSRYLKNGLLVASTILSSQLINNFALSAVKTTTANVARAGNGNNSLVNFDDTNFIAGTDIA